MKANLGSFAAALKDKDVWVMNAVPEDGPNMLKIVYDRGLIGTIHGVKLSLRTQEHMIYSMHGLFSPPSKRKDAVMKIYCSRWIVFSGQPALPLSEITTSHRLCKEVSSRVALGSNSNGFEFGNRAGWR